MIDRYKSKELDEIFSLQHRYDTFLKIELEVIEAYARHNVIPQSDALKIRKNACFDLDKINEMEKLTRHDVVAFTRVVSESLGEERKWLHYSLTSTDVVDTALSVIYKDANAVLEKSFDDLLIALKEKAIKYKHTPCIGRTHGIHGEVTSWGLKWAMFYNMVLKGKERFINASLELQKAKLSGAVGNFANIPSYIQDEVAEKLGLKSVLIASQVLPRDDHAFYMATLGVNASVLEQIATEIRLLSQTELGECEEEFISSQKGSSAMPHKRNPVASENIVGCSRVIRGYVLSSLEDVALWHERDISHSSCERIIIPDAIMLFDYMLKRLTKVITRLFVNEDRIRKNIYLTKGITFSQRVLNALITKGKTREEAYDVVQKIATNCYLNNQGFYEALSQNEWIMSLLTEAELIECFSIDYYLASVDEIYQKLGL